MDAESSSEETVLRGHVESQAALQQLLAHIHDLALELIEVRRSSTALDLYQSPPRDDVTGFPATHEIVLLGEPTLQLELLLPGMLVWPAGESTIIYASFADQAALLATLFEIHAAGHEIVSVRRLAQSACRPAAAV
jgi:hypothetical protein